MSLPALETVLAVTFALANMGWIWSRGAQLWVDYVPGPPPKEKYLVVWPLILGMLVFLIGVVAPRGAPGGWGWPIGSSAPATTVGAGLALPIGMTLATLGPLAAAIDSRSQRLPDLLTAFMGIEVFIAILITPLLTVTSQAWYPAIFAATAVWVFPLALGRTLRQVGLGDVKIAAVLGAALGTSSFRVAVLGLSAAFVAAAIYALVPKSSRRSSSRIALGPFLIGGALLSWCLAGLGTANPVFA